MKEMDTGSMTVIFDSERKFIKPLASVRFSCKFLKNDKSGHRLPLNRLQRILVGHTSIFLQDGEQRLKGLALADRTEPRLGKLSLGGGEEMF